MRELDGRACGGFDCRSLRLKRLCRRCSLGCNGGAEARLTEAGGREAGDGFRV